MVEVIDHNVLMIRRQSVMTRRTTLAVNDKPESMGTGFGVDSDRVDVTSAMSTTVTNESYDFFSSSAFLSVNVPST
jgi:hypothetical protein